MTTPQELLGRTAELVAIASESHHEGPLVDHLEGLLSKVPWLSVVRVGDNLVARTDLGRGRRVLLGGHTDTVPANGNVEPRRDGDTLWGLGAADMKGGLALMLELARTVESPAIDVTYLFYAREEVAFVHSGLLELARLRPDLLDADLALLGEPTGGAVEAGCQGTMRIEATFRGVRAHTARPWMGDNAIHRVGAALARVAAYEARRPVLDGCEYREALQAVRVEGGVAGNVVPDRALLTLNHRFAPDRTAAEAEAHVRSVLAGLVGDDDVAVVDVAAGAPPGLSDPLLAGLIERGRLEVRAKLGWTDVAFFAGRGIPAANLGPGDSELAHTRDEHITAEALDRTWRVLRDLLVRGAAAR